MNIPFAQKNIKTSHKTANISNNQMLFKGIYVTL